MQLGNRVSKLLTDDGWLREELDSQIRIHSSNQYRVTRFNLQFSTRGIRIVFRFAAVDEPSSFLRTKPFPLTVEMSTMVRVAFGLYVRDLRNNPR